MNLWQETQDRCWNNYLETGDYKGSFSMKGLKGAKITGALINNVIPGKTCLDIGCGIIPKPYYMKVADKVTFTGVDPLWGDKERDFIFCNAKAEDLPFGDSIFDGILFATSLDHVINIGKSISEAYRVLKTNGHLFVWTAIKKNDEKYQTWLEKEKPAMYDDLHIRAFTDESIRNLLRRFRFIEKIKVSKNKRNQESVYHYMKCEGE